MRTEKFNLCKSTKKLLTLITLLTLGVGQMWGGTSTTVYYAVPSATVGSYSVKCNTNHKGDGDDWHQYTMTKSATGVNFAGTSLDVYTCTFTDTYNGLGKLQFQLYDGSTYKSQIEPISSWTSVGTYNGKVYFHSGSGWVSYPISYSIAASSTIVWDLGENSKSWSNVYLNKFIDNSGVGANDAFTQIGSTTQWYKTYASQDYFQGVIFRSNTSNWNSYDHTTNIERNISGVTLFTWDGTDNNGSTKKLNWQVTTSAKKATSGTKIYFDKTNGWDGEVWFKYGTQWYNRSSASAATLVTGTDALYVITMPNDAYYEKYYLASDYGWTGYNPINDTHVAKRIDYVTSNLTSDITYVATGSTSGSSPTVYATTNFSGHTRTLTITAPSNGSISATYTDENGDEQTVTSGSFSVAQTCKVTITATPNDGYALSALTLGGNSITSGAEQIIRADGTIAATFVAETTYSITVSHKCGSRTFDTEVLSVGVTTPRNISSQTIDGFSFSSWSNLTNVTNHSANLTTDPISITSTAAGSMTCNYTQWPCSLDINTTSGNTGYTSRVAMTYDATTKAYYKEFTTTAATQYFRFYINSKKYAPSSDTEVVISGTKVAAATDVTGYGSNMPSVYFNDGGTGSKIKVWFDYEKKKAWVEEVKYTVTISAGSHGSVSPTSVSVGNVVASGTISATADDHYHLTSWTIPSGVTIVSGSTTTSPITIKATAAVTVTANFAGDQYTISYKDQGNVSYSGSNLASLPGTHTYGTATALVNGSKIGYDFVGWYTDASCTSSAGSSIGATAKTDNFTLYAKWSAKNYTTANNLKEADGTNNGQYNVTYDNTSIAHTSAPSRTGYTVEGYYKQAAWTNKIANTDLSLVSSSAYTKSGTNKWNQTSAPNLYIKWQQTLTLAGNGAGSTNGRVTTTYLGTASSHTAATRTGYTLNGYYDNTSGGNKILTNTGTLVSYSASVSDYINSSGKWIYDGTPTLSAQWTANTYTITLDHGVNGSGSGTATIDYDAGSCKSWSDDITQTGYHISGWYAPSSSTKVLNDDHSFASTSISGYITDGKWSKAANCELQAWWDPDNYTVTLDVDEDHQGTISGATTSHTVTYNTVTTNIPNLPTAEDYYGLDGYYTGQNGAGTKVINGDGTFIASVDGYTDEDAKWIKVGGEDLYAYYKQAEITSLVLTPSTQAPGESVTATPTISPTPEGTTMLCWKLLRANGNLYADDIFSDAGGNAVSFNAPETSGSYKVACIMRSGNTGCGFGTVLDSVVADLVVAGAHTVTIRYQDGSGRSLAASSSVTGRPLEWSGAIDPETITGYTFDHWVAGDGVTISTDASSAIEGSTTTTSRIYIKATYDGNLTAVYNKKRMIYFYNTLNWESVYVYFYKNDSYWESSGSKRGSGASTTSTWTDTPYSEGKHGQMQPVSEGSKIYYFDAEAAGVNASYDDVVFTEANQHGYEFFYATKAARRGDYKTSLPMYVPLADQTPANWNSTDYYDKGYWMNYPENTGYTLKIYNWHENTDPVREYPFPYSDDLKMPLKLDVEFNSGGANYWFMIYRNDGNYYGNTYTFNQNFNTEQKITSGSNRLKLVTSAPGIYTLTLTYHDNGDNPKTYDYYIDVDFPVAVGDYRIVYKDNATWSNGAHNANWYHPSDVIVKKDGGATEDKKDIVSFYIAKGAGITTSMKFQYASAITDGGAITWTDVPSGTINLSSYSSIITKAGVYNFHINQPTSGGIAVESVEPYTGTYYIRTDCAGNTKWDSYTTLDHQMTYSDYAAAGSDGFTHYYCHWVTAGTNVKFVIANDYSVCISDTLEGDTYTTQSLAANANIRFMYDERTNVIKRAYIAGSGNITDRFLVLEGDAKMYDEDGHALTGDYQDHDKWGTKLGTDNQVILHDDENFVYERTIMVNPQARAKLTAKYNSIVQYFKGSEGDFAVGTTIQLLGGDASATKYKMRIVYDFKTNRLVTAYIPGDEITGEVAINADVMLIREHQEAGQQLTFTDGNAKLTQVQTVYGVMRFNRWTLNNRANPEDHDKEHSDTDDHITEFHPLVDPGSMKSVYERALYWISFPFDVNLSDVFGFGTYGTHWILMDYNGAERARIGYWKDNDEGFWEYIWDRRGVTLEAGRGYVLALELDLMQANDRTFWSNDIQQVELFFPSSSTAGTIKQTAVDVSVESHLCTIDRRTNKDVPDWNNDRRVADSHWNIIGVPSYANYGSELTDGTNTISWHSSPKTNSLPFLYEWNANDNTYTVQSGTRYNFKAMHAYYVQYAGTLHWTLASATPAIVARRTYAEESEDVELKIELQQNEKMIDQTFVKLSNDEEVSANFAFGEDMDKEFNAGKANVYTFIEGYIPSAGNALPMSEQTTIVPVGVSIPTAGEYTFAIPDGTEGVGVILVDNVANTRTNLSALDYTVNLTTGTHDGRFVLEISPIHNATTGIEAVSDEGLEITGARKMIIDQKLYIVKDGKLFDATGKRVE